MFVFTDMDHEGTSTSHLIKQQDHGLQLGHSSTTKKKTRIFKTVHQKTKVLRRNVMYSALRQLVMYKMFKLMKVLDQWPQYMFNNSLLGQNLDIILKVMQDEIANLQKLTLLEQNLTSHLHNGFARCHPFGPCQNIMGTCFQAYLSNWGRRFRMGHLTISYCQGNQICHQLFLHVYS